MKTEQQIIHTNTLNMYRELMDKKHEDLKFFCDFADKHVNVIGYNFDKQIKKLEKSFDEAYFVYHSYL